MLGRRVSIIVLAALLLVQPGSVADGEARVRIVLALEPHDDAVALPPGATRLRVDEAAGLLVLEAPARMLAPLSQLPGVDGAWLDVRGPWLAQARIETEGVMLGQGPRDFGVRLQPSDPRFSEQYAPQRARLPFAWNSTTGTTASTVCIVDTGVRATHAEFSARYVEGYDVIEQDAFPQDTQGHGTAMAGIALAGVDDGIGIAGAGNVALRVARVADSDGWAWDSDVASGVAWCAQGGNRTVINLSLGTTRAPDVVTGAIRDALDAGALVVAAAGNRGPCDACIDFPAALPDVVAVGCTDASDALCTFSPGGAELDVVAPGDWVVATSAAADDAYGDVTGTSASAALVSGIAALAWSADPTAAASVLREKIAASAQDVGPAGWDSMTGCGVVDAAALLAGSGSCVLPPGARLAPHDAFARAASLLPTAREDVNLATASRETGEPNACEATGPTVWYAFSPAVSSHVTIDPQGSDVRTAIAAYTGGALPTLSAAGCASVSPLQFDAFAGSTYYVQVAGFRGDVGHVRLSVRLEPLAGAPSNLTVAPAQVWRDIATPEMGAASKGGGFTYNGTACVNQQCFPSSYAFDGDLATGWGAFETPAVLTLRLADNVPVHAVAISTRCESLDYSLEWSMDGRSWTGFASHTGATTPAAGCVGTDTRMHAGPGTDVRHLRLAVTRAALSGWGDVFEVVEVRALTQEEQAAVRLSWEPPTGEVALTGYRVERRDLRDASAKVVAHLPAGASEHLVPLPACASYVVAVRALTAGGVGAPADRVVDAPCPRAAAPTVRAQPDVGRGIAAVSGVRGSSAECADGSCHLYDPWVGWTKLLWAAPTAPSFLQVDLVRPQNVSRVVVSTYCHSLGIRVETSVDGATWEEAAPVSRGRDAALSPCEDEVHDIEFATRPAVALRVHVVDSDAWQDQYWDVVLRRIEVFSDDVRTGRVWLSWEAPANDGGERVTGYVVARRLDGGGEAHLATLSPTATSWTDEGGPSGDATYFVRPLSVHAKPEGNVSVRLPGAPAPVQNLTWVEQEDGTIRLQWEAPAHDGGLGLDGFRIAAANHSIRSDLGDPYEFVHPTLPAAAREFLDTTVVPGGYREYEVRAVGPVGEGEPVETRAWRRAIPVPQAWDFEQSGHGWGLLQRFERSTCLPAEGAFALTSVRLGCEANATPTRSYGAALSPVMDLPPVGDIRLVFRSNATDGVNAYDRYVALYGADAWWGGAYLSDIPAQNGTWVTHNIPLNKYRQYDVRVRFVVGGPGGPWPEGEGWSVDDVRVVTTRTPDAPSPGPVSLLSPRPEADLLAPAQGGRWVPHPFRDAEWSMAVDADENTSARGSYLPQTSEFELGTPAEVTRVRLKACLPTGAFIDASIDGASWATLATVPPGPATGCAPVDESFEVERTAARFLRLRLPDHGQDRAYSVSSFEAFAVLAGVRIEWGAPAHDGYDPVGSYEISRVQSGRSMGTISSPARQTEFAVATGLSGTATIRARNGVGLGPALDVPVAVPGPVRPALALRLDEPAGEFVLEWSAVPDATAYRVDFAPACAGGWRALTAESATTLSLRLAAASRDVEGCFRVSAHTPMGRSTFSPTIAWHGVRPPGAVRDVSAVMGTSPGTVHVSWSPPSDAGNATVHYRLYRVDGGARLIGETDALSWVIGGLAEGERVTIAVEAYGLGGSAASAPSASAAAATRPDAPANFSARPTGARGEVALSWEPPPSDGGLPVSGYTTWRSNASDGLWEVVAQLPATARSYLLAGIPDGQNASFAVSATSAVGEGQRSGPVATGPPGPPPGPLAVSAQATPTSIRFQWWQPGWDGGSPLTGFLVERASESNTTFVPLAEVGAGSREYLDTNVTFGAAYWYRVRAVNAFGGSDPSVAPCARAGTVFQMPAGLMCQPDRPRPLAEWAPEHPILSVVTGRLASTDPT